MDEINRLEKDSILYYQGGGADIALNLDKQNLREFYNVDNSYIVINALLMPGISNERARLIEERKSIDLIIFEHMDELIEVYCRMYSAMCKYTCYYEHMKQYHTYRADRMNTLDFLDNGQMYSFMSTKEHNDKNKDFHNKNGILLLEVEAQGNMEHIDVNDVLKEESKYPHENEILFAPFALLDKESLEMTDEEKSYEDINGNPPEAKYLLHLRLSSVAPSRDGGNEKELEELYTKIIDSDLVAVARQVWETFMNGREAEADIVKQYVEWKEKLQMYLRMRFARIKYKVMYINQGASNGQNTNCKWETGNKQDEDTVKDRSDIQDYQKQMDKLEEDVREYYNYTNEKRVKYRDNIRRANVAVSVLYPLTTFLIALSFWKNLQVVMNVIGLLTSGIGAIIPLVAKGLAWNENFQQRTTTYLKLDELMRDMRYEKSINENSLDKYVERFKTIIREDNEMGRVSAGIMAAHLEKTIEEFEKK